ncbi:MAG: DUF2812 domain-containing protein [Anaerolineae bacterium]|nr:DUF2812 domain-containing protein [Anaerolineae bacterium]
MRNQQIKKVNRIFFSGQHEEKQNWLDQMAADGWQLTSESSFVYSFQRVASELVEKQHSYRSVLGSDFRKSMPLFQEPRQDRVALITERKPNHNNMTLTNTSRLDETKLNFLTKKRRLAAGVFALFLFLIVLMTKIAIISTGDFMSLFKIQFFTGILFVGTCLIFGLVMVFKVFIKVISPVCKTKK